MPKYQYCLLIWVCLVAGCARHHVVETSSAKQFPANAASLPAGIAEAIGTASIIYIDAPDGVRIPVRLYGESGSGIPVLMTHGLQSHSGWFTQSAAYLAAQGSPVYAIDRRGSGLSDQKRGDCNNYLEMIDDLDAVARFAMTRHERGRVHLLGHCFGAIPATAFACDHPGKVESLILSTPGIYTQTDLPIGQKLKILWSVITRRESYVPVPLDPRMFSDEENYIDFIRNDEMALRDATASFYYQVPRARRHIRKNSGRLTMPVLMATAGMDGICDNVKNVRFFEKIPAQKKQVIEYPDAVHILEFSKEKNRFFNDLEKWINEQ